MPTQRKKYPTSGIGYTNYDNFPYPANPYQQTHPRRLETLGSLFGMTPPDIRHCRVLEMGCADGANLIPMACGLPESAFTGIDLSSRQLAIGIQVIKELDLSNVELHHLNILDVDLDFGTFDYIIVHGVYSWVPNTVQEKVLSICREHLSPQGIAYVSYNTNPGWRMRGMLRDMMLYHSRRFDKPQDQIDQARALIDWLSSSVATAVTPYSMLLKSELEQMQHWQDSYFRHDSLEDINTPVYFYEFAEQVDRHGLQYLGEAEFHTMLDANFPPLVRETLDRVAQDIIQMEQYMDFLRNRMFRQTLLCHKEIDLNRALTPQSLANLYAAAQLQPESGIPDLKSDTIEEFRSPSGIAISTGGPVAKAALQCLAKIWPESLLLPELLCRAESELHAESISVQGTAEFETGMQALGDILLFCYSRGLCELHVHPPIFSLSVSDHPIISPLARLQARKGNRITNYRHECVVLDAFDMHLAQHLDGQHDKDMLLDILSDLVKREVLVIKDGRNPVKDQARIRQILREQLDAKLEHLSHIALLVE